MPTTDSPTSTSTAPTASSTASGTTTFAVPTLKRRALCMMYEGMLLFGVVFIAGWLFSTLLQQRHALYLREGLQLWLFAVLGLYFCWFWTHGGQTLAMKTWKIRLVDAQLQPLSWPRALGRYLLSWLWFAPAIGVISVFGLTRGNALLTLFAGMLAYALLMWQDRDRQFLHDRLCGTRLISIIKI